MITLLGLSFRRSVLGLLCACTLAGCIGEIAGGPGGEASPDTEVGTVEIALSGVPDRVQCVRLEVVGLGSGSSTTYSFGVAADRRDLSVGVGPLAFGVYLVTAYAYDAACTVSGATASWRSAPASMTINAASAAHDEITLRPNVRTSIDVGFKPYVESVAVADSAGLLLGSDGRVVPLGRDTYTEAFTRLLPNVEHVFAGQDIYCASQSGVVDRPLHCAGSDTEGSLGNGTAGASTSPVAIAGVTDVVDMDAASRTVCAVTARGQLWCWGDNADGQIVEGITTDQVSPVSLVSVDVREVAVGTNHICHVTHNGTVACRGSHVLGQLGESASGSAPGFGVVGNAVSVAAGISSTYALLADGTVVSWGGNSFGQLGNGAISLSATPDPQQVRDLSGVVEIAAAGESACARTENDDVYCWGSGGAGNLGTGRPDNQRTPVLVIGGARSLTAGTNSYCVVTTTDDVLCWGRAQSGLFGGPSDDINSTRWVPTLIDNW